MGDVQMTRVTSIDAYHEAYVDEEMAELRKNGYKIIEIKRVGRMFFIFGKDITEIYFK